MWAIGLPLSLLIRHKPEQYGYLPDGEQRSTVVHHEDTAPSQTYDIDIGMKQALKSRTLWHIGLAMALMHLSIGAVILHVMPYLSSVGIARLTASLVATATPLVSIIGRFISGWLGDRFNKKIVTTGFIPLMCLGLLSFIYASGEVMWVLVPFIIFFGIGWGGTGTLRAALLREYFGRRSFGAIFGLSMGMTAVGTVVGPLFAGWVFDNWGSYRVAWVVFAILNLAALIIMATTPPVSTNVQLSGKGFDR
jgi:MFS family permease